MEEGGILCGSLPDRMSKMEMASGIYQTLICGLVKGKSLGFLIDSSISSNTDRMLRGSSEAWMLCMNNGGAEGQ